MTTDPGDLVLDPTCGSGTTATVAEQWGRRWITIDTSRVALALARARIMSARYPYYFLADSPEGRAKEQEVSGRIQPDTPTTKDMRQGFVHERAPHITLKSIANNAEIDVIWETWQRALEPLRAELNRALRRVAPDERARTPSPLEGEGGRRSRPGAESSDLPSVLEYRPTPLTSESPTLSPSRGEGGAAAWEEWQIPRELDPSWPDAAKKAHAAWWAGRIARQKEIDASIARAADVELLYDRPYEDRSKVRVAGPFTVESLSAHRVVTSRDDTLGPDIAVVDGAFQREPKSVPEADFGAMVLENLRAAGVHQKDKADAIKFSSLEPWPGEWIAAEGRYADERGRERRAGIFIGPEFGTVTRDDLIAAAREASEARFDVLDRLRLLLRRARLRAQLPRPVCYPEGAHEPRPAHVGGAEDDLEGQPLCRLRRAGHRHPRRARRVDPREGERHRRVRSGDRRDPLRRHQGHRLLVHRHRLQRGKLLRPPRLFPRRGADASDPYKSLKTALRAEIDEDAWATLYRDTSRPFPRPETGRIAVKVINHFGDEVLKVFGV